MPITKGFQALVDEAMAQVITYSVDQVRVRLGDPKVQIVDIRDPRELEKEGTLPGALLAPRGMLEFWVDPASPYFKSVFADEKKIREEISGLYSNFCGMESAPNSTQIESINYWSGEYTKQQILFRKQAAEIKSKKLIKS